MTDQWISGSHLGLHTAGAWGIVQTPCSVYTPFQAESLNYLDCSKVPGLESLKLPSGDANAWPKARTIAQN